MSEILPVVAKGKYNKQLAGENQQVITLEHTVCGKDTIDNTLKSAVQ